MIKLYGRGQSRSFRGLWALYEAGVEFEYTSMTPEDRPENYAVLNPQGKVPTMEDGEIVLTESAAIVNYAGMVAADDTLLPRSTAERARYDEIAYFVMTDLEQPLWTMGKHRFALPEEHRKPEVMATAIFEFAKSQKALHHHMDGHEFTVGNRFTLADVLLAHTINWAERFEMSVDALFIDYRDRMYSREACQKSLSVVS